MARLDTDLLGLQIVARDKAVLVGEIDGLILDEDQLTVAGFLADLGLYEARVLPFEKALAIGEDAIIVETAEAVGSISEHPGLDELARKEITITDATAITLAGDNVGTIGDFYVDTETGRLVGLEFHARDTDVYPTDTVVIPATTIHRLGRDIVVLQNDYDKHFLKDVDSLDRMEAKRTSELQTGLDATAAEVVEPEPVAAAEVQEPEAQAAEADGTDGTSGTEAPEAVGPVDAGITTGDSDVEQTAEEEGVEAAVEEEPALSESLPEDAIEEPAAPEEVGASVPTEEEPAVETAEGPSEAGDSAEPAEADASEMPGGHEDAADVSHTKADDDAQEDTFDGQQKHFLVGKRVVRRIETPSGEVVADEGQIVDYEMIRKAKENDLLLILSLNVE